jgi:hypothetical protein
MNSNSKFYAQSMIADDAIYVSDEARNYSFGHGYFANYFTGIGRFKLFGNVWYFCDAKNDEMVIPVVIEKIKHALLFQQIANGSNGKLFQIAAQFCVIKLGHKRLWALHPYELKIGPCEYFKPQLLAGVNFERWMFGENDDHGELVEMQATLFSTLTSDSSLKHTCEYNPVIKARVPSWLASQALLNPKCFKDCDFFVKCKIIWASLYDGQDFEISEVLAILFPGGDREECPFMKRISIDSCPNPNSNKIALLSPAKIAPKETEDVNNSKPKAKSSKRKSISDRQRRTVFERDGFTCCDCGASPQKNPDVELHVDHRIPVSKGGTNALSNLQTLCKSCNLGKSADFDWKLKNDKSYVVATA